MILFYLSPLYNDVMGLQLQGHDTSCVKPTVAGLLNGYSALSSQNIAKKKDPTNLS